MGATNIERPTPAGFLARRVRSWRFAGAFAVVGLFVVENHCGGEPVDHRQLALHLLERGHFDRALVEARRATREHDSKIDGYVISSLAYLGLDRVDEAVASLTEAIQTQPDDPRLYATLREVGLRGECIDLVRDALVVLDGELQAPHNWHVRVTLAWVHRQLNADELALPLFVEAVETGRDVDPEHRRFAHLQLSRLYMETERFAEAASTLNDALLLDPDDRRLNLTLGECRLKQGELDAADAVIARAVQLGEGALEVVLYVARLYHDCGEVRRAIDYYELALERGADKPLVLNNLAWAYAQEHVELERATRLSLQAVKIEADNVVYLDTYAELLYVNGQYDRAIAVMEQALQIEPESGKHYEYLQGQLVKFRAAPSSLQRSSAAHM